MPFDAPSYLINQETKKPRGFAPRRAVPQKIKECRDGAFDWLAEANARLIVEVGSQWGWWAYRAAKQLPDASIWCVDPWAQDAESVREWSGKDNFFEWQANVAPWLGKRVFGMRGTSEEVVDFFPDGYLCAVFIDGDHSTESVALDLKLWVPKVKQGGLILGHDWDGMWGKHVRPAVQEYFSGLGEIVAEKGYLSRLKESAVWRVKKTWT